MTKTKTKQYEVTFECIWSVTFVEAENEDKAIENAYITLAEDLKHNMSSMFDVVSVIEQKEE